jgi:hypothetical protein
MGHPQALAVPGIYETGIVHGFDAGTVPLGLVRYPGATFGVPVVWSATGMQQLPAPETYGFADSGNGPTIVGTVIVSTQPGLEQACIWQDDAAHPLIVPGTHSSRAVSINASGVYVGNGFDMTDPNDWKSVGYFGKDGSVSILNYLSLPEAYPLEVNDSGWFTGVWQPQNNVRRPFVGRAYSDEAYALDMPPGFFEAIAQGINNDRTVVGSVRGAGDWEMALIWPNGSPTPMDLNDFVDVPGVTFIQGLDINNAGQILAEGRLDGGGFAYYVLTPVPEPASAAVSLVLVAASRRKARSRRCRYSPGPRTRSNGSRPCISAMRRS